MSVRVRTQQELNAIQEMSLIPEGKYAFKVKNASDEYSKSGNSMTKLVLELNTPVGKRLIFDYLVDVDSMAFKVKHFCESTGIQASELDAAECKDAEGHVEIVIKKGENGYPPRNAVADYVAEKDLQPKIEKSDVEAYFNDDIPF